MRHLITGAPIRSDPAAGVRDLTFAETFRMRAEKEPWIEFVEPHPEQRPLICKSRFSNSEVGILRQ